MVGEGALLAALDKERTGRMRDIVATIQAEQDEAIRADITGILVVAGGPGTGKTAVALHRAAYLLYTHRKRLASQGVLLVGPSPIFLRYIDEVLPSLGEDEVSLATPAALKPRLKVRGTESEATAAVKGDVRMAKVIAAAIGDRERPMPRDVVVSLDGYVLRLRRRDSVAHHRARARAPRHAQRAPSLRREPACSSTSSASTGARSCARTAPTAPASTPSRSSSSSPPTARPPPSPIPPSPPASPAVKRRRRSGKRSSPTRVRRLPDVRAALDRMWPVLSGTELVRDLFGFAALIRSASGGVLTDEEQALLFRERGPDLAARGVDRRRPRAGRRSRRHPRATERGAPAPRVGAPAATPTSQQAQRTVDELGCRCVHQRRRRARPLRLRRVAGRRPTTTASRARSATCSSTRRRTSPRCSGACSPVAARRVR